MKGWEGVVLDGVEDWKVREPLEKMNRQLGAITALVGTAGQGAGGGSLLVPTKRENEIVISTDLGVPLVGATSVPGIAHLLRCTSSGVLQVETEGAVDANNEWKIAELPSLVASATGQGFGAYLEWPTGFSYIAGIGTVRKASTPGSTPDKLAMLTGAPIRDVSYGYDSGANLLEEVYLHSLNVPRCLNQAEVVFNGNWFSGGIAGFPTVTFGTGGVGSTYRSSYRFRQMALCFNASIVGTPVGTLSISVYGLSAVSPSLIGTRVKQWQFDESSWVDDAGYKYLEFGSLHPSFTITMTYSGTSSSGNYFKITNCYVVGKS